jgi:transferase
MKSFAQWSLDRKSKLRKYEEKTHPNFIRKYSGQELTFEDIYQILTAQNPEGWSLKEGDTVLDLGCGTGWYARKLSTDDRCRGALIIGLDISENALEIAREKQGQVARKQVGQVEYRQADLLQKIPVSGAKEIWFCGAWHQTGDPVKSSHRVVETLSQGGMIHIQAFRKVPEMNQAIDAAIMELVGHHIFSEGEIESIAERLGLKLAASQRKGMIEL